MRGFFTYQGRLNRARYFVHLLLINVAAAAVIFGGAAIINAAIGWTSDDFSVYAVFMAIPFTALTVLAGVKRLHDLNRPGSHYWQLTPFYGLYLGVVMLFKRGTTGANPFGDDPLADTASYVPPEDHAYVPPGGGAIHGSESGRETVTEGEPNWMPDPGFEFPVEPDPPARHDKTQFMSAPADHREHFDRISPDGRKIVGFLVSYTWQQDGQIFPVREGRNLIGRDAQQCDIAVPQDETLSEINSHITFRKKFVIGDMMSMKGTELEGQAVEEQFRPLHNYARIRTGSTEWTFISINGRPDSSSN
ncbi:MAG TPA: DUF805 domain-containing protein [Terriglobales bacterium]|jgi:uncharacterized membrane protein YhaH (DUF805 family)